MITKDDIRERLSDGDIIDIIMDSKNIVEAIEEGYRNGYIDAQNDFLKNGKL